MKGANIIPADNFLTRVTKSDEERMVRSAADANMNMLRVWGGGVYASDEFYHQCDEKGILVWQDLMFAGGMYPGDTNFMHNVVEEVKQQAIRLRNHPCLALWCGNNEIDEGWHNWGWQKQYQISQGDSDMIWTHYTKLFHQLIPGVLDTFFSTSEEIVTRGSRYWPSSPAIGWGHKESLQQGDSHYWGVWWGNEPVETYKRKVGRFMSEYGIQSMPSTFTIKKFIDSMDMSLSSEKLKTHQKYTAGFSTMLTYMIGKFKPAVDMENFVYLSQLVQADGIKTAIEAHRKAMPYCMGSLFWQLNDCWPAISWSSMDRYGNWKALQYQAKRSFQNVLITVEENEQGYSVHVVSDLMKDVKGNMEFTIFDFAGKVLWHQTVKGIKIFANKSGSYCQLKKSLIEKLNKKEIVLSCTLNIRGKKDLSSAIYYFVNNPDLELRKPTITIQQKDEHSFTIKTDVLAKNIYIHLDDSEILLSDNYFDLLPGNKKTITILSAKNFAEIEKKIRIQTLFD